MSKKRKYVYDDLSINDLRALLKQANRGSIDARQQLKNYYIDLAREANNRLSSLKRQGYDYFAYDKVTEFTRSEWEGSTRFRYGSALQFASNSDLYYYAMEARHFLGRKTSTVAGQIEVLENKSEYWGLNDLHFTLRQKKDFLKIMSDSLFDMADNKVGSPVIIDVIKKGFSRGYSRKDILNTIDEYMRRSETEKIYFDEFIEERLGVLI